MFSIKTVVCGDPGSESLKTDRLPSSVIFLLCQEPAQPRVAAPLLANWVLGLNCFTSTGVRFFVYDVDRMVLSPERAH